MGILTRQLNHLRRVSEPVIDALTECLFPSNIYCISCGKPVGTDALYSMCDDCLSSMLWANKNICSKCGKLLEDWYPDDLCAECKNIDHVFEKGLSCVQYGEAERQMIKEFKYHGKAFMARKMAEIMNDRLEAEDFTPDIIVPVPMHSRKEKKRGYNQAGLLAKYLAKSKHLVYHDNVLLRIKDTEPMNKLNSKERHINVSGAFGINEDKRYLIDGKSVLLIDDIFTTGSTADECSSKLLEAGAYKVWFISFASGANQRVLPEINIEQTEHEVAI